MQAEQQQSARELSVSHFGTQLVVRPYAAQGTGLLCSGPIRSMMVQAYQCGDQQAFWDAWRALGGESQGLEWEGGATFAAPHSGSLQPPDGGAMAGGWLEWAFLRWARGWLRKAAAASWRWVAWLWELPAEDSPEGGA